MTAEAPVAMVTPKTLRVRPVVGARTELLAAAAFVRSSANQKALASAPLATPVALYSPRPSSMKRLLSTA